MALDKQSARMQRSSAVRRTTINLDTELVAQAREVLEAGNTTDTVHRALREVVRRDRLRRLAERDWDITLEDLKEMRRSRVETKAWGSLEGPPADVMSAPGAASSSKAGRPRRAA